MVGVHAPSVVAQMVKVHLLGDGTSEQDIGHPVSACDRGSGDCPTVTKPNRDSTLSIMVLGVDRTCPPYAKAAGLWGHSIYEPCYPNIQIQACQFSPRASVAVIFLLTKAVMIRSSTVPGQEISMIFTGLF